jgi:hypothetical protein
MSGKRSNPESNRSYSARDTSSHHEDRSRRRDNTSSTGQDIAPTITDLDSHPTGPRLSVERTIVSSRGRSSISDASSASAHRRERSLELIRRETRAYDNRRESSRRQPTAASTKETILHVGSHLDVAVITSHNGRREELHVRSEPVNRHPATYTQIRLQSGHEGTGRDHGTPAKVQEVVVIRKKQT